MGFEPTMATACRLLHGFHEAGLALRFLVGLGGHMALLIGANLNQQPETYLHQRLATCHLSRLSRGKNREHLLSPRYRDW